MDIITIIFITILLISSVIMDVRTFRIPNILTYSFILLGISYNIFQTGYEGFIFSVLGVLTGIGLLFFFYLLGWMGAGDAKLLGAIGAFIGAKDVIVAFIFSALIGGMYAIIVMVLFRDKFRGTLSILLQAAFNMIIERKLSFIPLNNDQNRPKLCYGLAIAAGTGIFMICAVTGFEVLHL